MLQGDLCPVLSFAGSWIVQHCHQELIYLDVQSPVHLPPGRLLGVKECILKNRLSDAAVWWLIRGMGD